MGSSFSPIVHHMSKGENNFWAVTSVTPLTRLSRYGEVVQLQSGKCWDASGNELKDLPGWAYEEMGKMTAAALKEVGFDAVPKAPEGTDFTSPELVSWTCPECRQTVDSDMKDEHVARHLRRRNRSN